MTSGRRLGSPSRKSTVRRRFCHAEVVDSREQPGPIAEPEDGGVRHDPEARRFVLEGGHGAFLQYDETAHGIVILHTEVPTAMRGRNVGGRLAEAALSWARRQARPLTIVCPFVRAYVRKHPQ